jgi:chitin synthase
LGTVATSGGKNEVEVEVPSSEKDINSLYEDAIHVLNTKPPKVEAKVDAGTQQEDYYRNFRTKCVVFLLLVRIFQSGLLMVLTLCLAFCFLGL